MPFNKPPKSYAEQVEILKGRGLLIPDEAFAEHCLRHHNYYRLSAYRFAFTTPGNPDQFIAGTSFDNLWGLYCFDRRLRLLVMEGVKRLEISVRTNVAYTLAHTYGVFSYEDPAFFYNRYRHTKGLATLDEELRRSKEIFVKHYHDEYNLQRPPIWAACEVMSFGLLSRFYENIKAARVRKTLAAEYGLAPHTMKSLLLHAVYVRNLCAHHSRLWNRRFTITLALPHHQPTALVTSLNPSEDRRIYNTLAMLAHIVNIVEPENHWSHRLRALLHAQTYPVTQHMGFPADWEMRPLWQKGKL
ncbi:MAG: Abi family protein [Verrucomicrobia bacterium]|nr:Abi family protein [Verrucomicrobiota bacterium]